MKKYKLIINAIRNGNFLNLLRRKIYIKIFIKSSNAQQIEMQHRTYKKLYNRYKNIINSHKVTKKQENSNYVWVCWFQGLENAPDLVKACINSIKKSLPDRNIVILTNDNIKDYINFPEYIIKKYEKGIISKAHFSDLIRIELLCNYGGIWIDSTVLCTSPNIPHYILNAPLFVYKAMDLLRTNQMPIVASSWLISAQSNNPILSLTRDLLFRYWKEKNYLMDYYLFHIFFTMATRKYKKEWENVPTFNNNTPHTLMFELGKSYTSERFEQIKKMSVFHKLERHTDYSNTKDTMYEYIIKTYGG